VRTPRALVRVPGAPNDIAFRPSGMIAKVVNTLARFHQYGGPTVPDGRTGIASEDPGPTGH